ncbi:metallophosphoesterase [Proteinivorax hydrogeniformans]|uniref:Metallophosphoesterase n=1 Tax=Proteinivorax hydrogeniformans TaxID=1826727 RepID=A0AAU8HW45_9FIRM
MTKQVYVIGDIHGRLDLLKQSLKLARIIDKNSNWQRENILLIQLGDVIDRGPQSLQVVLYFQKLKKQAKYFNSDIEILLGNHELMALFAGMGNNYAKFHWYFNGGDAVYSEWNQGPDPLESKPLAKLPQKFYDQFSLNGNFGKVISQYKAAVKYKKNLFVHGGIVNEKRSIDEINKKVQQTITSQNKEAYQKDLFNKTGPFWARNFTEKSLKDQCLRYNINRQIVGHTPKVGLEISNDGTLVYADLGMNQNHLPFILSLEEKYIRLKTKCRQHKQLLASEGCIKIVSREKSYPFTRPKFKPGDLIDLFSTDDSRFYVQFKVLSINTEKIIWYIGEFIYYENGKKTIKPGKWPIGHIDKHGIKAE